MSEDMFIGLKSALKDSFEFKGMVITLCLNNGECIVAFSSDADIVFNYDTISFNNRYYQRVYVPLRAISYWTVKKSRGG